jgi:Flp pilus assembly protein TadD
VKACTLALALWLAAPSLTLADGSWVGKAVILKPGEVKISQPDTDGKQVYVATLDSLTYKVEAEQGDSIRVNQDGVSGWLPREKAVLADDAVAYFTREIEKNPKSPDTYNCRAAAWKYRKELDKAVRDYDEAIRLDPRYVAAYCNRGNAYVDKNDYDRAFPDYDEAIQLDPRHVAAYYNRGNAHLEKKDYDRAIHDCTQAIYLRPKHVKAYVTRGVACEHKKDYDRAVRDFREVIQLDPKNVFGYNNLAWLLATCPDDKCRSGEQAVKYARRACELTDWKTGVILDTLAAAYAEAGQFGEAVKWQQSAMAAAGYTESQTVGRKRLALYKDKKPYRDTGADD